MNDQISHNGNFAHKKKRRPFVLKNGPMCKKTNQSSYNSKGHILTTLRSQEKGRKTYLLVIFMD